MNKGKSLKISSYYINFNHFLKKLSFFKYSNLFTLICLQFLGTWHELERTTFQWGENTWHSQVWVFKRGANGHLYMAYTGYS